MRFLCSGLALMLTGGIALAAGPVILRPSGVDIHTTPSVVSCPLGSCPPLGSQQLTYSLLQQYGTTMRSTNWEIGAVFGLLDTTGGGTGQTSDQTNGAKMGAYIGLLQTKTGGPGWALNTNIVRNVSAGGPNALPGFAGAGQMGKPGEMDMRSSTIGYELDVSNFDRDSNGLPPRYPFVVGEYLTTTSTYPGWAGLFYGIGNGQHAAAWHDGILFSSPNAGGGRTASDNTILDLSSADVGYHSYGRHATAGWYDETSGKYGLWLTGTKTIEDIDISSQTPVGLAINGQRPAGGGAIHLNITAPARQANSGIVDTGAHGNGASYNDHSSGEVGINAAGTYHKAALSTQEARASVALIAAPGQKICLNGQDACVVWESGKLIYLVGQRRVFSIDPEGNLSIRGVIKQRRQP